jgi:hypothetical protein
MSWQSGNVCALFRSYYRKLMGPYPLAPQTFIVEKEGGKCRLSLFPIQFFKKGRRGKLFSKKVFPRLYLLSSITDHA